jgi:hypothetical protein
LKTAGEVLISGADTSFYNFLGRNLKPVSFEEGLYGKEIL